MEQVESRLSTEVPGRAEEGRPGWFRCQRAVDAARTYCCPRARLISVLLCSAPHAVPEVPPTPHRVALSADRSSLCPGARPVASCPLGLSHFQGFSPLRFRYLWCQLCSWSPTCHHWPLTLPSQGFLNQKLFFIFKINIATIIISEYILCSRKASSRSDASNNTEEGIMKCHIVHVPHPMVTTARMSRFEGTRARGGLSGQVHSISAARELTPDLAAVAAQNKGWGVQLRPRREVGLGISSHQGAG